MTAVLLPDPMRQRHSALTWAIPILRKKHSSISSDDVFIVLSENKEENWSFGRGQAELVE